MSVRKLLITGATGKQGSAVVDALVAKPPPYPHEILALTRNPKSASAQKLTAKSKNISLLSGDLNDCPAIFQSTGGPGSVWGVFSVQVPATMQKGVPKDIEEVQGRALVDAAMEAGVQHFVYTSVDRGGSNSINDPTEIPHFITKHNVEKHLIKSVEDSGKNKQNMTYTILRPVAFNDNLAPDFSGKGFAAMWYNMGPDHPLQLVGCRDIGIFAAQSFTNIVSSSPDQSSPYKNTAISLAGDELTQAQGAEVFQKVFGKAMPTTFAFVGTAIQFMVKEVGIMFRWFVDVGYKADIAKCRQLNPDMQDFETWLREDSGFAKKG